MGRDFDEASCLLWQFYMDYCYDFWTAEQMEDLLQRKINFVMIAPIYRFWWSALRGEMQNCCFYKDALFLSFRDSKLALYFLHN